MLRLCFKIFSFNFIRLLIEFYIFAPYLLLNKFIFLLLLFLKISLLWIDFIQNLDIMTLGFFFLIWGPIHNIIVPTRYPFLILIYKRVLIFSANFLWNILLVTRFIDFFKNFFYLKQSFCIWIVIYLIFWKRECITFLDFILLINSILFTMPWVILIKALGFLRWAIIHCN